MLDQLPTKYRNVKEDNNWGRDVVMTNDHYFD